MRRLFLTACFFSVAFAAPSWAGFQEGWNAYYRGDYATALKELQPIAQKGHPAAQINLGIMYEEGQGVPQDYAEALKWYRRAVRQDYAEGQFRLGGMYAAGKGVPQNTAEAVKWYRQAAAQRDTEAMQVLGIIHFKGQGVAKDPIQAFMWYELAVTYLPPGAFRNGVIGEKDVIAVSMTRDQVHEAQSLARQWQLETQQTAVLTPTASPSKVATVSKSSVKSVQEDLAILGYDPGPADGMMGPRTKNAIRAFENDQGLTVTGQVSPHLQAVIREKRQLKTEGGSGS